MRRLLLLALALLLAACVVYPADTPATPLIRLVGPDEAQAIIWDATSTARSVQTQSAHATATEVSARATETRAARATADSLMVVQTMLAVEQTRIGALALATDAASVKTQAAAATATAAPQTRIAAAADVQATASERATAAARAARNQAREDAAAEARRWGVVVVLCLFLAGLGAAVVFGVSDWLSARADKLRADAARAEAEARQLWIMQYGGRLLQLDGGRWIVMDGPLGLAAPEPAAESSSPVREVPVRVAGEVVSTIPLGEPETPERERVLHLLGQAAAIAGPDAGYIPSAEQLGLHPQDWQTAVNSLKATADHPAYVMATPGRPKAGARGGTRLIQPAYRTLGALRDAVKRGDVLPRPAATGDAHGP